MTTRATLALHVNEAPAMSTLDPRRLYQHVESAWNEDIVPELQDYIRIPNQSPAFDPQWEAHGYMDQAIHLMSAWARRQAVSELTLEIVRLPGRTPLIFIEVPGVGSETVLLYGHLDKQPPMNGWAEHLGPWKPVIENERLYGRGGADDGYALFASLTAIAALQAQGIPHARCVLLIEACEESGSGDLPHYVEHLSGRIGQPSLVVCLDSGCGDYQRLWSTTSLRGLCAGDLRAEVLTEGVHSGDASGIVPSSFRVLRQLLDRIEDPVTGQVKLPALHAEVPDQRVQQAGHTASIMGEKIWKRFPFVPGMSPVSDDLPTLVLARSWKPTVSVTGVDGVPPIASAGNVLRPQSTVKLSVRLPPTVQAEHAAAALKAELERDPPYGAAVCFEINDTADGWSAPPLAGWLENAIDCASARYFGASAAFNGEGGSIPFMGMLGTRFPDAQFLITGVLGPGSNAHGPNEFLDIPTGKRITACVADVLAAHSYHFSRELGAANPLNQ